MNVNPMLIGIAVGLTVRLNTLRAVTRWPNTTQNFRSIVLSN